MSYSSLHTIFAEHLPDKTNVIKFLGLQLDNKLSWKPHINYLLYRQSSVCFIMTRLFHVLNIQTLRTVYFVCFHSSVNYGITFWGNTSSRHKTFLTQKRVLRIMLRIRSKSSCTKCLKKLVILPAQSLYINSLMLFVVQNMHYVQTNSSVHEINTRYKNQLHAPSVTVYYTDSYYLFCYYNT
jgi:hypothetical protein